MNTLLNYNPDLSFPEFPDDELLLDLNWDNINTSNIVIPDVIPAIPTMYLTDWTIDTEALDNMLQNQKKAWIDTVLIAGTTWESSFLDEQEHLEYIRNASIIANEYWIQVIAWTWSNSTREQNNLTKWAFENWAIASLLLPPYYIKCSNGDLIRHLSEWLNHWPAIIYSISWRTWMVIPIEVIQILSKHPNFLWVKECDWGDRIRALKKLWIRVWTWNDDESFLNIHDDWADWTISVVCNVDPELMLEVKEWIWMTKNKINRLLTLSHLIFLPGQPNPKPIHNAMEMIRRNVTWLTAPATFRSPWWPLNIAQQKYLANGLEELWIWADIFWDNYNIL